MSKKLINKEQFERLPLAYRKSILSRFFRPFNNTKWSKKYGYLKTVGDELIKSAKYPDDSILEAVEKALLTKKQRNSAFYKKEKMKRVYASWGRKNTRKNRKTSKWKLKRTEKGRKLATRTLNSFHYFIWKSELKFLHNWYKWDLTEWHRIFNEYRKYQKAYEYREGEIKTLIPQHYTYKCCTDKCKNEVYITRKFNIKISDLFCVMCQVDYEKGAIYLDKLVSNLEKEFDKVKKKKEKTLKNG